VKYEGGLDLIAEVFQQDVDKGRFPRPDSPDTTVIPFLSLIPVIMENMAPIWVYVMKRKRGSGLI
jgi:hypothetical protein